MWHGCDRGTATATVEPTEQEEQVHDTPEDDIRRFQDVPALAPPIRLAGVDEDDTWEPHVIRGID
jgi:hypothetical protein